MLFDVLAEHRQENILKKIYRESGRDGKKARSYSGAPAREMIGRIEAEQKEVKP